MTAETSAETAAETSAETGAETGAAPRSAAVIGAGVVGLSCAVQLLAEGLEVTVIERERPAAGASAGNAGALAFSELLPLASPKMLRKAPRWLADPLGPLSVPPACLPRLAPWLLRFALAARPGAYAASVRAQADLMRVCAAAVDPFLALAGAEAMRRREGNLELHEGEASLRAARPGWDLRRAEGIAAEEVTGEALAALQPGLSPAFTHGVFVPGWHSVADPKLYTEHLAETFRARGGRIEIAAADGLRDAPGGVEVHGAGALIGRYDRVVIAAGAHSRPLAAAVGVRVPLETERGYNTTLPPGAFDLRRQLTFPDHGFVVSRIGDAVRVGGAVELAGLARAPNFRRAEAMLAKAARFLPGLKTGGGVQWMGFRPSLPDTLPAIGAAPAAPRVLCAFGHGHLGLTQSAGTAALIADIALGRPARIDLSPFAPDRFRGF